MRFFGFLILGAFIIQAQAQTSDLWKGQWGGIIATEHGQLDVMIEISVKNGTWVSYLNVPDQLVESMRFTRTEVEKKKIEITMDFPEAEFSGRRTDSNMIKGVWKQNGKEHILNLTRVWGDWPKQKPQTPQKPYPWVSIPVKLPVAGGRVMLAGELNKPDSAGQFPVVILISGSGPQDRNGSIGSHKPFLVLTQLFTSMGYAVLRFDDRGAGYTTGHPETLKNTTTVDMAGDVSQMTDWLLLRQDIKKDSIGLLGHSEGGIIATYTASHRSGIAFLILLASPETGGYAANVYQNILGLTKAGFKDKDVKAYLKLHESLINLTLSGDSSGFSKKAKDSIELWKHLYSTSKSRKLVLGKHYKNEAGIIETYAGFYHPWWQFFFRYKPENDLKKISVPILALNGTEDKQVEAGPNLELIRESTKNALSVVKEIKGVNHLFQNCKTCDFNEYFTLDETFSPILLNSITDFIKSISNKRY